MNNKKIIQKTIDPDNEKIIFNRSLAAFLLLCNVRMTNVAPDLKDFSHDVFYFKKGIKLNKGMMIYNKYFKSYVEKFAEKINKTLESIKEKKDV